MRGYLDKETVDREYALCRKLSKKNGGACCWGECAQCGVIPLLHKLGGGGVLEKKKDIETFKKKIFG